MEINLTAVSPVCFDLVRVGDRVRISLKQANRREFREKIGPAQDCYLVFRGVTKLGMVPRSAPQECLVALKKGAWAISRADRMTSTLVISLLDPDPLI